MNPYYLFKEELIYELGVRGIVSDADKQHLRSLFRAVVREDRDPEVSYLRDRGFQDLCQVALDKITEFQKLVD
jgi:hypothetical protein